MIQGLSTGESKVFFPPLPLSIPALGHSVDQPPGRLSGSRVIRAIPLPAMACCGMMFTEEVQLCNYTAATQEMLMGGGG